jgi:hypothetical protein
VLYLLDANILISANNKYYPINRVPEFWDWLIHNAQNGHVKLPIEIIDEVIKGNTDDPLYKWIYESNHFEVLTLDEDINMISLQRVINKGYASNLTEDEVESIGRDPFLIAYAIDRNDRCVVTNETRSNRTRHKRKIPDVCDYFSIPCCDIFAFNEKLNFSTSWMR